MTGVLIAFGVVFFVGFIIYWIWSFFNHVSMTNSERKIKQAEADIIEEERDSKQRLVNPIEIKISEKEKDINKEKDQKDK